MKSSPEFDFHPFKPPILDSKLQLSHSLISSLYTPFLQIFLPIATTLLVPAAVTVAPGSSPAPLTAAA